MSRVGKKPIPVPDKINITYQDNSIKVKGPKGELQRELHPSCSLQIKDNVIEVVPIDQSKNSRALQGLTRSLVANMIIGVDKGFERNLEINGIGYRAEVKGSTIVFNLGYSTPKTFEIPSGISVTMEKNNLIKLSGIDKEQLGHTAAAIRRLRPPEPYKGKGIKYAEEYIQRKAGKTGTK